MPRTLLFLLFITAAFHVPATFHAGTSGLVVALHGSQGSGLRLMNTSGLNAESDAMGFAVAYPFSLVSPGAGFTEWNEFYNHSYGSNPPDDVGFIRQVIQDLQTQVSPDPKRIYVTGLSNGGMMAHRVGVQLSSLVAAIGVVEGTLVSPGAVSDVPAAGGPVSVLILHGDQDPNVAGQTPYNPDFDASTGITSDDILWRFFAAHPKP